MFWLEFSCKCKKLNFAFVCCSSSSFQIVYLACRCFGGYVSEGYGMTETSCLVSGTRVGDNTSGHVGAPTPACGKFPEGLICFSDFSLLLRSTNFYDDLQMSL